MRLLDEYTPGYAWRWQHPIRLRRSFDVLEELADVVVGDQARQSDGRSAELVLTPGISAGVTQKRDEPTFSSRAENGIEQRRVSELVDAVDRYPALDQHSCHLDIALLGGEVQWRETILVRQAGSLPASIRRMASVAVPVAAQ
jgi:hypothetical protein